MVEVEKYIKRLLYDQDCVIIPDFGGVLTQYLPARFDPLAGHYLPSQRKVAFNEVLKIDDGLLAKFISENEGMPYVQAQRHIRDFVQTVQSLLKKNKTVTLAGIGAFQLTVEGRLMFQPDPNRNFHAEFYGLQPVTATKRGQVLVSNRSQELAVRKLVPEIPVNPSRKIAWGNWISAASIACILVYVSAVLSGEPGATSSLNPVETVRALFGSSSPAITPVEEMPGAAPARPATGLEAEMTAGSEVSLAEETTAVSADEEVDKAAAKPSGKRFFIIASVYESKSSLDKYGDPMAAKLRSLGYEEITMIPVRDKYLLSAGSFASWNEAQKAIPTLARNARGAWIYKQRQQ